MAICGKRLCRDFIIEEGYEAPIMVSSIYMPSSHPDELVKKARAAAIRGHGLHCMDPSVSEEEANEERLDENVSI